MLGYSTLFMRAMILLCLIFSMMNLIFFKHYSSFDIYYETIYTVFGWSVGFAFATATSVGLIYGVKKRESKFVLPYLIGDFILTVIVTIYWVIAMCNIFSNFPEIIFATLIAGEKIDNNIIFCENKLNKFDYCFY